MQWQCSPHHHRIVHRLLSIFAATVIFSVSLSGALAEDHPLGAAGAFDVFVFSNHNANNTDVTGRVAVGGHAQYANLGIGSALSNSDGQRNDLIVQGNLLWNNGQNFKGNSQVGGSKTCLGVNHPNGSVGTTPDIDFNLAQQHCELMAVYWAGLPSNGTVTKQWGQIIFQGQDEQLNVFTMPAADFSGCYGLTISVPEGSTVLVNLSGPSSVMMFFQIFLDGADPSKLLFNFSSATSIMINGIGWKGTILAPHANIQFNNGHIDGAMIAYTLQGNGETHHVPFTDHLPTDDEEEEEEETPPQIPFAVGAFD